MALGKSSVLVSVAFAFVLGGFDGWLRGVEACSCPDSSLCDGFRNADVVLHAKALSKAGGSASSDVVQFEDVTYTVEVIKMYKEEDGETYGSELTFTTSASSSLCGISLEISDGEYLSGQEYLLDLNRHESTNELRAVGLCGVFKDWSDDDEAVLEGGCPSTPSPGLSPGQEILAETDSDDSSALRLTAYRGMAAAGIACFVGCMMVL